MPRSATPRTGCCVWQASHNGNLAETFALLTQQLRARCYSPAFTSRAGSGAALGNRIAAAAIAAGRTDGSNEELGFADPTYTPQNQPLIVAQSGSTVHDASFWQPLALAQVSPRGSGAVPAAVQTFVGSQWGGVKTFAGKVARSGADARRSGRGGLPGGGDRSDPRFGSRIAFGKRRCVTGGLERGARSSAGRRPAH